LDTPGLTIAAVATLTGVTKEVLRKWEVRYGFPVPARDGSGNRKFTAEHVARLQTIKTLLDSGLRAGAIVPMTADELAALLARTRPACITPDDQSARDLITCLQSNEPRELTRFLENQLAFAGLRRFVCEVAPVMNALVGAAWLDGRIAICNEHLYTENMKSLLAEQLTRIATPVTGPRVLLTTPTGEMHSLGLMMVQAILALEGADCISLGNSLDAAEITLAALQYRAEIIGISFSDAFPPKSIPAFLGQIRQALPASVAIWAGGAAAGRIVRKPAGVNVLLNLPDTVAALHAFQLKKSTTVQRSRT
jgi:DNA-binding transcriptional MerR regulator/methylmalonyl-CoA mutase cobalamin-binding subunit